MTPTADRLRNAFDLSASLPTNSLLPTDPLDTNLPRRQAALVPDPGNTLGSAYNLGTISGASRYTETVGDNDTNDYYQITVAAGNNSVSLFLSGLSANADLELYNSNGQFLPNEFNRAEIGRQTGTTVDTISRVLNPGTYYVRVFQAAPGQNTDYKLSLLATSSASPVLERNLEIVNFFRTELGLTAYRANASLARAAQLHTEDMAINDYFNHRGLNGSSVTQRAQVQGYQGIAGENISAGSNTPEGTLERWMSSNQGHRDSILDTTFGYQELGVGYYNLANDTGNSNYFHYWTQVFGTPSNPLPPINPPTPPVTPPTPPTPVTGSAIVVGTTLAPLLTFDYGNIAAGGTSSFSSTWAVDANNPDRLYRAQLSESKDLALTLSQLIGNADVRIIYDRNNNGIFDDGEQIAIGNNLATANETINLTNLAAGTYYFNVYRGDTTAQTPFRLETSWQTATAINPPTNPPINPPKNPPTNPPTNPPITASGSNLNVGSSLNNVVYSFGNNGLGGYSGSANYSVDNNNSDRLYLIQLGGTTTLTANLSQLTGNADMRLIYDRNRNGIFDDGEQIAIAATAGTANENLVLTNLAAGNYYMDVYRADATTQTPFSLGVNWQSV